MRARDLRLADRDGLVYSQVCTDLCWDKGPWLAVASHMVGFARSHARDNRGLVGEDHNCHGRSRARSHDDGRGSRARG